MFCMKCGKEITEVAKFCAKCGAKVEITGFDVPANRSSSTSALQSSLETQRAEDTVSPIINTNKPTAVKQLFSTKLVIIGGVLVAMVAIASGGYMFWMKASPKYSVDTVAGKFEIKNKSKDEGAVEVTLNGKPVDAYAGMAGITSEIYDVFNINDRSLVIMRWDLTGSKYSDYKYSVFFGEIDKNGNYRQIFSNGIPTDSKSIDVSKLPDKIEFKIKADSDKVGYQKVVYQSNGNARQISEWKWADKNRQKAEDEQARREQARREQEQAIQESRSNESALCKMIRNTFANAPDVTRNYQLANSGCAP